MNSLRLSRYPISYFHRSFQFQHSVHSQQFSFIHNSSATFSTISGSVRTTSSPRKPTSTRAPLTLTLAAIERLKILLSQKPEVLGVRIGVRTRGCNGLSYTLDYCTEKNKFDEEVEQDGVKVIIDSKAQLTLLGTEMDYQVGKLTSEFVFNNPNIKGTCGCGESFNV